MKNNLEGTMQEALLSVGAAFIAGMIVMILHELPKSIIYCVRSQSDWKLLPDYYKKKQAAWKDIWKVWKYIDPIGLLLCITTYSGFSKPYMYRMKDRKTNKIVGLAGFIVLLLIAIVNIIILKNFFVSFDTSKVNTINQIQAKLLCFYFFYFMAFISINMFIVNLVPISTFNMGVIIASSSPSKYFSIIQKDHIIKIILLFTLLLGIISTISSLIMDVLLTML